MQVVNIQQKMVTYRTYPDKFIPYDVVVLFVPFVLLSTVIDTLPVSVVAPVNHTHKVYTLRKCALYVTDFA